MDRRAIFGLSTEDIETTENTTGKPADPCRRPMNFSVVSRTFYLKLVSLQSENGDFPGKRVDYSTLS